MEQTLEQLQQILQERIEALDKQRREEASRFAAETTNRNALAEADRAERLEQHKASVRAHEERKAKEAEEAFSKKREEERKTYELEQALNSANESKRLQQEKLEWLQNEIAKLEFVEEQHAKATQSKIVTVSEPMDSESFSIEHPTLETNEGNAVAGTGGLEQAPAMSQHLRHILRQAQRD